MIDPRDIDPTDNLTTSNGSRAGGGSRALADEYLDRAALADTFNDLHYTAGYSACGVHVMDLVNEVQSEHRLSSAAYRALFEGVLHLIASGKHRRPA